MSNVVVISGHPDLDKSWTNKVILQRIEDNVENVDIRRLDELYPDYNIDIEAEQNALVKADIIILQYPYYWYSVPALLKKWIDDVFAFDFAFGPNGNKLKDKDFILSFTVGGPKESYNPLGYNHFTIEQLAYPLQQLSYLSGMIYHQPIYTHRMVYIPGIYNTQEDVVSRAEEHAANLLDMIQQLSVSPETKLERFINNWFINFDALPQDNNYFIKCLSQNFELEVNGNTFFGPEGFNEWYHSLLEFFNQGVTHTIEQITFKNKRVDLFDVAITVRVKGQLKNGETINQLVNEAWEVSIDDSGELKIESYKVLD